jgi:diguanylate cyclase (GGDEF)-like protein
MLRTPNASTAAYLRHEYRTPVNHIVGYSELLIDESGERHLEAYIPALREIQQGGRRLLESVQNAFDETAGADKAWEGEAFRRDLAIQTGKLSGILATILGDLKRGHSDTLGDLAAILGGIRRLNELAGQENPETSPVKPNGGRRRKNDSPEEDAARVPGDRRGRILIADDDEANRDLLRRCLESEGHEVSEARNGLEVLDALRTFPCDLVLLDLMMPVMDGFETLTRIQQDAGLKELPVIMISALEEVQSVANCIEMGAVDYLAKPFNRVLLRARIGASLEKKRLLDRERERTKELERTLRLLEDAREQLTVLASRDTLTGLENRRSIEAQLDARLQRDAPFSAIYIDLNGFKKINDTYGHEAGDELLRQVGKRLRTAFRVSDAIGRWGGDEFVALVDAENVQAQITRVAECLAADFAISDEQKRIRIGAAVGAAARMPGDSATSLLHRADFAMYEVKLRNDG